MCRNVPTLRPGFISPIAGWRQNHALQPSHRIARLAKRGNGPFGSQDSSLMSVQMLRRLATTTCRSCRQARIRLFSLGASLGRIRSSIGRWRLAAVRNKNSLRSPWQTAVPHRTKPSLGKHTLDNRRRNMHSFQKILRIFTPICFLKHNANIYQHLLMSVFAQFGCVVR